MTLSTAKPQSPQNSSLTSRPFFLPLFLPLLGLLLVVIPAYFQMYYGFSSYDDEGYLLATVKAVVQHHVLYDQIYTLYGPFYYLVEWIFYATTGFAPSLDCVRFIGLVLWPISCVLLTWPLYLLTRSLLVSGFALVAFMKMLVFFQWGPGHPEDVCIILLACLMAVLCSVSGEISATRIIALGVLAAAIAQTKINLGLYVSFALLLALLMTLPKSKTRGVLLATTGTLALILITGIMSSLFRFSWVRDYYCVFLIAFSLVLLSAFSLRFDATINRNSWYFLVVAYVLAYAAILVPFLIGGTTIWGFLYVTILQHRDFTQHWFRGSAFDGGALLCCLCSLALFAAWRLKFAKHQPFLFALQMLKGILGVFAAYQLLIHGVNWPLGATIMSLAAPFTWLILLKAAPEGTEPKQFVRIALAFLSVFVNLYAFPVAGSQDLFAIVPLVAVLIIFLHDAAVSIALRKWTILSPRVWRVAAVFATLLIAASYARKLRVSLLDYSHAVPLALPGAAYIRVAPEQASTLHWLTRKLNAQCPSFFSMPGLFSLYFWTRRDSPTQMMMNDWPGFLGPAQQKVVLRDLGNSTSCIVYSPELIRFFHAVALIPSSPLAQYIHSNFVTTDKRGGYEFMVRKRVAAEPKAN